jgi:hypothetical protein
MSAAPVSEAAAVRDPLPEVRRGVRSLLMATPAFAELDPERRRQLAGAMVRVCHAAALLLQDEMEADQAVRQQGTASEPMAHGRDDTVEASGAPSRIVARAQAAVGEYRGVSASQVAGTTRAILNAVSFPRFVTDLLNGVFKAMVDSSVTQMNAYVQLLNDVAASVDGFTEARLGPDQARNWVVERYPGAFEVVTERDTDEDARPTLRLRDGATMPAPAALRTDLGLTETDPVPTGDPERTLVPLVRRQLAKQRQEMLATMVMLGMQRIVVDSGRITAAMRFHIDTRSAAEEERANRLALQHSGSASASFGVGWFGFSGTASHSIGYVSTERRQTTEEMNTDLELNSSVEVNFRSDQLPLERMTTADKISLIKENALNPAAEAGRIEQTRRAAEAASEQSRRRATTELLRPDQALSPPKAGEPGSIEAARNAQTESTKRTAADEGQPKEQVGTKPSTEARQPAQTEAKPLTPPKPAQ